MLLISDNIYYPFYGLIPPRRLEMTADDVVTSSPSCRFKTRGIKFDSADIENGEDTNDDSRGFYIG